MFTMKHVSCGQIRIWCTLLILEGTCPGAALSLVQVELSTWPSARTCPLIQVISQTAFPKTTFFKLPFCWRRVYTSESRVIHQDHMSGSVTQGHQGKWAD